MRNRYTYPTSSKSLRITWVLRSFLDYRIAVFSELDGFVNHQLHVIFPTDGSPERVQKKISATLGPRAISLPGGMSIGIAKPREANTSVCLPFQPGLYRAIAATKPDVLIGDGFFQWTRFALWHRLLRRVPLVVCYERTFHTERNAQWYRNLYRRVVIQFVDACCVNGQQSLDYTHFLGMPTSRITTGFMAADTEALAIQCNVVPAAKKEGLRTEWQAQGLIFLFVGQLIKRKGVEPLLNAWALFERNMPSVGTLVIAGEGPEEDILKQRAGDLKLTAVRFIGHVDYDRLASYYASADVFVMPTLEDNWSLVVPEAMACSLPVLTSRYNGCWPELVHINENGWVFDALDPDDICRCLQLCVKRQSDLTLMGQRSRDIVSQYSPRHAAGAILQACEIALANRGKRSMSLV